MQKKFVPKRVNYTTILCFLRPARVEYTPKDMHVIGKTLADLYRKQYGREPATVHQCEGRKIIPVNLYPFSFSKHIKQAVEAYFHMKKSSSL